MRYLGARYFGARYFSARYLHGTPAEAAELLGGPPDDYFSRDDVFHRVLKHKRRLLAQQAATVDEIVITPASTDVLSSELDAIDEETLEIHAELAVPPGSLSRLTFDADELIARQRALQRELALLLHIRNLVLEANNQQAVALLIMLAELDDDT